MSTSSGLVFGRASEPLYLENILKYEGSALIRAPVVEFIDESINALRIMRTPVFAGSAASAACHILTPALSVPIHDDASFNVVKEAGDFGIT
jgi:hypothetical protein